MLRLQKILDYVLNNLTLDSIPLQNRKGIFFIMLNDSYIHTKSLDPNMDIAIDKDDLLNKITKNNKQLSKLAFDINVFTDLSAIITIGVYMMSEEEDFPETIEPNQLKGFLLGIKEAIILSIQLEQEKKKENTIFEIIKKLYSSIDVNQVLQLVYNSIQSLYPDGDLQFWLAQDYETTIPVKKLSFLGVEKDHNIKAFLSGQPYIYETSEGNMPAISVPLKGKQAPYGVLQYIHFEENAAEKELEIIIVIAEAAGVALENAILYQQSQRLISQLRLINETTQRLNKALNFKENIDQLTTEIMEIFKPEGLHFFVYSSGEQAYQVLNSTERVFETDELIAIDRFQLLKKVHESKEAVIFPDTNKMEESSCDLFFQKICRSIIIVPLLHNTDIQGMLMITHSKPYYFSFDDYRLFQTLVNQASLAFVNSKLHQELNKMVITDNLTRLYARNYLDQEIILSQSEDNEGSFILMDIDNFKRINDTYGHQTGDDVLIQVANVIKSSIRESDIAARWGGEELAVYLPNAPLISATQVAERIRERVSRETSPKVTISVGLSHWQQADTAKSLESLFQKADQSLYQAKSTGKNQVIVSQI